MKGSNTPNSRKSMQTISLSILNEKCRGNVFFMVLRIVSILNLRMDSYGVVKMSDKLRWAEFKNEEKEKSKRRKGEKFK